MEATPTKRAARSSGRATVTAPLTSAATPPAGTASAVLRRPPLETALDAFTRELRKALDRSTADIAALRAELTQTRAELAQLRQRYEAHTHKHQLTTTGGGGNQWIELRHLQGYIDGEHEGFKKYGFWARGKSAPDAPPESQTGGPSG